MKVGMIVAMQNHPNNYQADHHLYWDECRLADLAEPLGFDSLWAVEHHFDNYAMIPDVVQFLTYSVGIGRWPTGTMGSRGGIIGASGATSTTVR